MKPPKCFSSEDWTRHCLHFDVYHDREDEERTLTCCDCGLEWTVQTFNRVPGTHGPHRTGQPMQRSQWRYPPEFRIVREPPDRLVEQETA